MKNLIQLEIERLHDLGLAIINIKAKDKRPVDSSWTSGPRHTKAFLLKQHIPGMNIGVRLGVASKLKNGKYLAAIDCDLKSSDENDLKMMHEKLSEIFPGWKNSPKVLSGRGNGSMHVYVSVDQPINKITLYRCEKLVKTFMGLEGKPSKRDIEMLTKPELEKGLRMRPAFEIELLCQGQQVLLPPSVHPLTNKEYTWEKILGSETDLIAASFVDYEKPERDRVQSDRTSPAKGFKFNVIDIDISFDSRVNGKFYELIVNGEGMEQYKDDRTAALMAVFLYLCRQGFSDDEILSILTDKKNYLGDVAFEHRKTTDRMYAAAWLHKYGLQKARNEIANLTSFDDEVEFIDYDSLSKDEKEKMAIELDTFYETEVKPVSDWRALLKMTENGNVKKTNFNIYLIIKNSLEEKGGFIFHDLFYSTEFIYGVMPWEKDTKIEVPRRLKDLDLVLIINWLSQVWSLECDENFVLRAISKVGAHFKRHSIREYLESCKWDGVKRLDSWLKVYMHATNDDHYLSVIGRKLILAMVYRVFHPGCQYDQVVIFQGGQGVGKSSAMRALGGEWFTDNLGAIGDKDALLIIHRHWLIEVAELDSMTKADADHFKQFVSSRVDEFRKPYGRVSEAYPRQCVLVGTTNREEFLKDDTGNRRFWPVEVGEVDVTGLGAIRDLLFAEAMTAYKAGELLWSGIDEAFKNSLKIMHEQFEVTDESENEVLKALSEIELECGKLPFTLIELYEKMNPLSNRGSDSVTLATSHRLGRVLRKHGFERKTFVDEKSKKRTKKWFFAEKDKKAQKTVKNDPKVTVVTDKVTVEKIGVTEDVGF